MKLARLWFFAGLGLLYPFIAAAQAPSTSPGGPRKSSPSQQMYEDIEIMRRILNRKLALWPALASLNANCTSCHVVSGNFLKSSEGKFVDNIENGVFLYRNIGDGTFRDVHATFVDGTGAAPQSVGTALGDFDRDGAADIFFVNDPHGHSSLAVPPNTEGVYLKSQGVVYTLTLPPPPPSRRVLGRKTSTQSVSEWERTRRAMRGDRQPSKETELAKESQEQGFFRELEKSGHLGITEAILKILGENGHNFSQLADDEKLTVVVTFRELHPGGMAGQNGSNTGNPLSAWGNNADNQTQATWETQLPGPQAAGGSVGAGGGLGKMGMSPGAGMGKFGIAPKSPSSILDFELLGDLSLKQGKAQEAIKAFQRALNLNPPAKQSAAIYRKIAQADLLMENDAAAKKALEMAVEILKADADTTKNAGTTAPGNAGKSSSSPSLAAKLIIAVPKKLADQVAAGKIRYEDFRQQATIDYFGFSSTEKSAEKSGQ